MIELRSSIIKNEGTEENTAWEESITFVETFHAIEVKAIDLKDQLSGKEFDQVNKIFIISRYLKKKAKKFNASYRLFFSTQSFTSLLIHHKKSTAS